jgi:hypothetical protein
MNYCQPPAMLPDSLRSNAEWTAKLVAIKIMWIIMLINSGCRCNIESKLKVETINCMGRNYRSSSLLVSAIGSLVGPFVKDSAETKSTVCCWISRPTNFICWNGATSSRGLFVVWGYHEWKQKTLSKFSNPIQTNAWWNCRITFNCDSSGKRWIIGSLVQSWSQGYEAICEIYKKTAKSGYPKLIKRLFYYNNSFTEDVVPWKWLVMDAL